MKGILRRIVTLHGILGLCVLLLSAMPALAGPKVLKFSTLDPDSSIETQLLRKHFAQFIEEQSNGRYKVDVYVGSALGNTDTVVQGLNMGTIHLAFDSASNLSQFAPKLAIFDLPYMFTVKELITAMNSPQGNKLKAETRKFGVQVVDFMCTFPRNIIARTPLTTVADMNGLKARSTNSKWHIFGLQTLGFKPIPMAAAEMLTGIQQGVVDCMDIAVSAMYGYGVSDVAKHVIMTDQTSICNAIIASAEWWDTLPAEDKDLITRAAHSYRDAINDAVANKTEEFIKKLREEKGCTVYVLPASEREIWRQKAFKAYENLPEEMYALFKDLRAAIN